MAQLVSCLHAVGILKKINMSYGESISLKLVNNTDQPRRIGLLGGTASTYANSNNNVVVQWDLSSESYSSNEVTLNTTIPVTVELEQQNIVGVVDALNTTAKGVFSYSGTTVSATTLTDNSVETATIFISNVAWEIQGYSINSTTPYTTSGVLSSWNISQDGNWFFALKGFNTPTSIEIRAYPFLTPFDPSTINPVPTYTQQLSLATSNPKMQFGDNGNYMFIASDNQYFRYTLSTPYDISTLGVPITKNINFGDYAPYIPENEGGKRILVPTSSNRIETYIMLNYNISASSFTSSTSLITDIGIPVPSGAGVVYTTRRIKFSTDGTKFFVFMADTQFGGSGTVYQCTCSIPFAVNTATYDNVFVPLNNGTGDKNSGGIFNSQGTKIIAVYTQNNIFGAFADSTTTNLSIFQ
jgi:hypothetical protein